MSTSHPLDTREVPSNSTINFSAPAPIPQPSDPYIPAHSSDQPIPNSAKMAIQPNEPRSNPSLPSSSSNVQNQSFHRFNSPAGAFPTSRSEGWEEAYDRQRRERYMLKVQADLKGWRGGHGEPRSGYSKEAVPTNSYFGQSVTGVIGRHLPKEMIRIERDWSDGEVCQFETSFPMELEGRVPPAQWNAFINGINGRMIEAYSTSGAVIDNLIAIATWWTSLLWRTSHFERFLLAAERDIDAANKELFNPAGLNVLSPRHNALQFIEYY